MKDHDNFRIQAFIYISTARINQHFMLGTFKQGLSLIPAIEEKLEGYHLFIDSHRILVLNYKIAMLIFWQRRLQCLYRLPAKDNQ